MINMEQKKEEPKEEKRPMYFGSHRGRPKKQKTQAPKKEEVQEPTQPKHEEGKHYVFKSKYREDIVNLIRPRKEKHADGSTFVDPGYNAEFHRNTWSTEDPFKAQLLRDKIKERQNNNPLHIVETTE